MENIHFLGMKDTNEREILDIVCLVFVPSNIPGFISEIEIKGQFFCAIRIKDYKICDYFMWLVAKIFGIKSCFAVLLSLIFLGKRK